MMKRILLVVGAFALAGCALVPFAAPPLEIRAVRSIEALDWVRAPDIVSYFRQPAPEVEPIYALRVTLDSSHDMRSYGHRYYIRPRRQVSLCLDGHFDPHRRVGGGDGYVYDRFGMIEVTEPSPREGAGDAHVYIHVLTTERSFDSRLDNPSHWVVGHDLRRDGANLCFRLVMGGMFARGPNSNTVVIPYATIRAALDRAGL